MNSSESVSERPSFGRRLLRTSRIFVRVVVLLLVILAAVSLGAAIFYGAPELYREYLQPVQDSVARLDTLEARIKGDNQQNIERLGGLETRLESLEVQGDSHKETFGSLQAGLDVVATSQATQQAGAEILTGQSQADGQAITQLNADLDHVNASVDQIATAQAELEALPENLATQQAGAEILTGQSQAHQEAIAQLNADLVQANAGVDQIATAQAEFQVLAESLATQQAETSTRLDTSQAAQGAVQSQVGEQLVTLQASIAGLSETVDLNAQGIETLSEELRVAREPLTGPERELQILRIIEMITRARLALDQGSASLARQDVEAARDLLAGSLSRMPVEDALALSQILALLEAALEEVARSPELASAPLVEAWRLLVENLVAGSPAPTATVTAMPTPTPTAARTPRPTPTPTAQQP